MMGGLDVAAMIRDLEEFRRLFRVTIPVPEHASYYINTLARSPEFADLPALAGRFAELEERLAARGASVGDYKHQVLAALRGELGRTAALRRLCAANPSAAPTRNHLTKHPNT